GPSVGRGAGAPDVRGSSEHSRAHHLEERDPRLSKCRTLEPGLVCWVLVTTNEATGSAGIDAVVPTRKSGSRRSDQTVSVGLRSRPQGGSRRRPRGPKQGTRRDEPGAPNALHPR